MQAMHLCYGSAALTPEPTVCSEMFKISLKFINLDKTICINQLIHNCNRVNNCLDLPNMIILYETMKLKIYKPDREEQSQIRGQSCTTSHRQRVRH